MSCDVSFEKMYTITVDGSISNTFPKSTDAGAGKKYNVTTNCTNGTGSWDETNWRMIENSNTNPTMKCNVNFTSAATWCSGAGQYTSFSGEIWVYKNGGTRRDDTHPCNAGTGPCQGEYVVIPHGSSTWSITGCGRLFTYYDLGTARSWCRSACGV